MKGAKAEPCDKINSPPKINRTSKMGINQYFFRIIINFINSLKMPISIKKLYI